MGFRIRQNHLLHAGGKTIIRFFVGASVLALGACQIQGVSVVGLEMHQAMVNRSGLSPLHAIGKLRVSCAPPVQWQALPQTSNWIYSHQQWRSPDKHVGMGVAYMRTPILFSPQTLIWFAKAQYANSDDGTGRLIAQWTDSLGRSWFEAENHEYHIRGYAMTRGHDAWIVYSGYRVQARPPIGEVLLASRGADSVALLPAND
jgi:hypothetical protein